MLPRRTWRRAGSGHDGRASPGRWAAETGRGPAETDGPPLYRGLSACHRGRVDRRQPGEVRQEPCMTVSIIGRGPGESRSEHRLEQHSPEGLAIFEFAQNEREFCNLLHPSRVATCFVSRSFTSTTATPSTDPHTEARSARVWPRSGNGAASRSGGLAGHCAYASRYEPLRSGNRRAGVPPPGGPAPSTAGPHRHPPWRPTRMHRAAVRLCARVARRRSPHRALPLPHVPRTTPCPGP